MSNVVYIKSSGGKIITDLRKVTLKEEQVRIMVDFRYKNQEEIIEYIPYGILSHKLNHKMIIKEKGNIVEEYIAIDFEDYIEENLEKNIMNYDDIDDIYRGYIIEVQEMLEDVLSSMIDDKIEIILKGVDFSRNVLEYDIYIDSRKINFEVNLFFNVNGSLKKVERWGK